MTDETDDAPVPKLPRGKGIKLGTAELFRIAITILFLVAVIMLTKPCSQAVSTFVVGFGSGSGSGAGAGSGSARVDPYERLTPDMTEQQVKEAIERSKAKNAALAGSASGSASATGSASASATGSASASASASVSGSASASASGSGSTKLAPAMNPTMQRRPSPSGSGAVNPTMQRPSPAPTTNP